MFSIRSVSVSSRLSSVPFRFHFPLRFFLLSSILCSVLISVGVLLVFLGGGETVYSLTYVWFSFGFRLVPILFCLLFPFGSLLFAYLYSVLFLFSDSVLIISVPAFLVPFFFCSGSFLYSFLFCSVPFSFRPVSVPSRLLSVTFRFRSVSIYLPLFYLVSFFVPFRFRSVIVSFVFVSDSDSFLLYPFRFNTDFRELPVLFIFTFRFVLFFCFYTQFRFCAFEFRLRSDSILLRFRISYFVSVSNLFRSDSVPSPFRFCWVFGLFSFRTPFLFLFQFRFCSISGWLPFSLFPFVSVLFVFFIFCHSYLSDCFSMRFKSFRFLLSSVLIPFGFPIPFIFSPFRLRSVPFPFCPFSVPLRLVFISLRSVSSSLPFPF